MRILFVANRMPYPPFRGDKLKIFNLAQHLSKDHELHLITIAEKKDDQTAITHLQLYFKQIQFSYLPKWKSILNIVTSVFSNKPFQVSYFYSSDFSRKLNKMLRHYEYDAIHVQHLRMSEYVPSEFKSKAILDLPDAFSLYWKRRYLTSTNGMSRLFKKIEYKRLDNYEKKILPSFPLVLVCSKEDKRYLEKIEHVKVKLLQNGVNTSTFSPKPISFDPFRILFTGNMDYAPNIDAVEYFVKDIFPLIKKQVPETYFVIAGQRPVAKVLQLRSEDVWVTGFIPDLSEEYAKAHIVVSPLRIGAGTQNKVLEALSMNVPVVSTFVGYEGLELPENIGVLPAHNAEDFASNCVKLLADISFRNSMGSQGGQMIRMNFSWEGISQKLQKYFEQIKNKNV